eukprot:gene23051-30243_t
MDVGALAAFVVGFIHMDHSLAAGSTMIFFYLSSSKLTKLQSERKAMLEDDFKIGGQRNAVQVLANSLGACVALVALSYLSHSTHTDSGTFQALPAFCVGAFIGHYSCCCADTWASEIGILSRSKPRLITSFKEVPPGTNGGMTLLGTGCCLAAGFAIGFVYFIATCLQFWFAALVSEPDKELQTEGGVQQSVPPLLLSTLVVSISSGLFGCELDSLLGATLQYSGFDKAKNKVVCHPPQGKEEDMPPQWKEEDIKHICGVNLLSNSAVNFIAAAASAVFGGVMLLQVNKYSA